MKSGMNLDKDYLELNSFVHLLSSSLKYFCIQFLFMYIKAARNITVTIVALVTG